jgi:hypothetical protein
MTLSDVLAATQASGIRLEARGATLHVEAPSGTMTPELREGLAHHKPAILVTLKPGFEYLRGGLTVPKAALLLALDLEERGIELRTDADHQFIVPDDPRLTVADRAAIARWFHHLGAIIEYEAPELS